MDVVVTFKCSDKVLNTLDRYAELLGVSRSELIREALNHYIFYLKSTMPLRETKVKIKKVVLK